MTTPPDTAQTVPYPTPVSGPTPYGYYGPGHEGMGDPDRRPSGVNISRGRYAREARNRRSMSPLVRKMQAVQDATPVGKARRAPGKASR
ncbi:hypothetical protein [Janibacter limosus]|uniref:Uncharacterized protein n=1 Tax=Janibacter limosus TaxID=53458 RepID=A0A4P6MTT1_9MICO|nr:hypothetical protein [Janibacter limosus]QBF46389.1 hypothetical protein EXU32_09080 [Janibacter limosus]